MKPVALQRLVSTVLCAVLVLSLTHLLDCAVAQQAEDPAAVSMENAMALFKAGKTREAEDMFEALVSKGKATSGMYYMLGICHMKNKEYSAAIFALEQAAAKARPKNLPKIYSALGVVYLKRDEFFRAEKTFKQALALNPDDAEAKAHLERTHGKINDRQAEYADEGSSWLHEAAKEGNLALVESLIERGAAIDKKDAKENATPLHYAAASGQARVAAALIICGADVNAGANEARTPLHLAAYSGDTETVELLIERGAEIDALDAEGRTPLLYATVKGHTEAVKLILTRHADIAKTDKHGRHALHWAARAGHTGVCQALIDGGALVDCRDTAGVTPILYAVKAGQAEAVAMLKEAGSAETVGRCRECAVWTTRTCPHTRKFMCMRHMHECNKPSDGSVVSDLGAAGNCWKCGARADLRCEATGVWLCGAHRGLCPQKKAFGASLGIPRSLR